MQLIKDNFIYKNMSRNINYRLGCIEFNTYTHRKEKIYEILKYEKNTYFNQEQKYIDEGYIDEGDCLVKEYSTMCKSIFESKEICYTIAFLKINRNEPCIYLESIGSRLLDLEYKEQKDFFNVYNYANTKLTKRYCKIKKS
jgi:hypothetical protein